LAAILSPALAEWLGPDVRLVDARAYLRRLFPSKRCSVELELTLDRQYGVFERRRLLCKLYRDKQAEATYQTLVGLRLHGLGTGRFLVPQPLASVPEHGLLLLAWAEGQLLSSDIHSGIDSVQNVVGAAEWLLRFHSCGVRTGRRYSVEQHLRTLSTWLGPLTEAYPEGSSRVHALLAQLEECGGQLPPWTEGPTHRDFCPEHLVIDGQHLTCLDFDEFCQYDPLFDVAHFVVQLRFLCLAHFGTLHHFDRLVDQFKAAYCAGAHDYSGERMRFYQTITYFKLARFVALVEQGCGWRSILPELLSEAERTISVDRD
jgi:thiamine kinase-like enzyme